MSTAYAPIQHGINCEKKPHLGEGYLHAEDDDTPYPVDGYMYCGRCHTGLGPRIPAKRPAHRSGKNVHEKHAEILRRFSMAMAAGICIEGLVSGMLGAVAVTMSELTPEQRAGIKSRIDNDQIKVLMK